MFEMDGCERNGNDIEQLIAAAEKLAAAMGASIRYCLDAIMRVIEEFSEPIYAFGAMIGEGITRALNPPSPEVFSIDGISYSIIYAPWLRMARRGDLDTYLARAGFLQSGALRRASHVAPQRSLVLPRYRRSYHRRVMAPNRKGSEQS